MSSAAQIQAYIRTNAARGRETERIGPFLATFSPHTTNCYLNYAIPDAGASPTHGDATALAEAYSRRGLIPRLEFLPGLAPAVEPALIASGFSVEQRVPLMSCSPEALVDRPVPDGIELVEPRTDDEIRDALAATHAAYDDHREITAADIEARRRFMEIGGIAVLARNAETGEAAGGGVCDVPLDGIGELAGFGVIKAYRRRGIAAAITSYLTRRAHEAGAHLAFLTPGGPAEERIYARSGFTRLDEVVFLSRP